MFSQCEVFVDVLLFLSVRAAEQAEHSRQENREEPAGDIADEGAASQTQG